MADSQPARALFLALVFLVTSCATTYRPTDKIPDGCEVEVQLVEPTTLTFTQAGEDPLDEVDVVSLRARVTASSAEDLELVLHEAHGRNGVSTAFEGRQLVLPRARIAKVTESGSRSRSFEDGLGKAVDGFFTVALLLVFPLWIVIAGS